MLVLMCCFLDGYGETGGDYSDRIISIKNNPNHRKKDILILTNILFACFFLKTN